MSAAPIWTLDPPDAAPGDSRPLLILDLETGPDGTTVCVVPGRILQRLPGGAQRQLLDEDDIDCARLMAAATRMQAALAALLCWADQLGGGDAPCWAEAQDVLQALTRG